MRILYSIAMYLATPFVLLHFAIRGWKDRRYLQRWKERFAFGPGQSDSGGIIIHAASVGELNAAVPLINALAGKPEAMPLTITTFTPTGSARAQSLAGRDVLHCYAPLDLPGAVRRFFEQKKPRLLIIMETEIWPNLLFEASRRKIPILMANARLSAKALKSYRRFRSLAGQTLSKVDHLAAQSSIDAERLVACGADPGRVFVTGNLKFDLSVPDNLEQHAARLRPLWGGERPVLIAGSTHEEDDVCVLNAFGTILEALPETLLILVPRHPERFAAAGKLSREMGFRTELHSNGEACSPRAQCFVIDAMGELLLYYACSDVAVIGGSFGPVGGHNALEASALGRPVIVGPNTENFTEITDDLISQGAATRVADAGELGQTIITLFQNPANRQAMGEAGRKMVMQGRGALHDILDAISRY